MLYRIIIKRGGNDLSFYQELQLNQAGSKALIRACQTKKELCIHTLIYIFKILLTLLFCTTFVVLYTTLFGPENSITGVVVLLFVMVFRKADLGIKASHASLLMLVIFGILAIGPRLSNMVIPGFSFLINIICILLLAILGCHNIIMFNHATLVLSYLLLLGNDVTGQSYILRIYGLLLGGIITAFILYHNHYKIAYKRNILDLFREFNLNSVRTRWQFRLALGVSSAMFLAQLFHFPRIMWIGFAAMSVLQPFSNDVKQRAKHRIPGTLGGSLLFFILCMILPEQYYSFIGILGGFCLGFCATYGWQTVFNAFGALSTVVGLYGVTGAVFLRIISNVYGVLFSVLFDKLFNFILSWITEKQNNDSSLIPTRN